MTTLTDLRQRIAAADGPSRELDAEIMAAFYDRGQRHIGVQEDGPNGWESCLSEVWIDRSTGEWIGTHAKEFTASLDAAVALVKRVLPGWAWKCGTCSVSDDAWICPDFNDPTHGPRLRAEIGDFAAGEAWDTGFDVDRRPPGNVPLALLEALFMALEAKTERAPAAL